MKNKWDLSGNEVVICEPEYNEAELFILRRLEI